MTKDRRSRLSIGRPLDIVTFFLLAVAGAAAQRIVALAQAFNLTGGTLNVLPPPGTCTQQSTPQNAPEPARVPLPGETSVTLPGAFYNLNTADNFLAQFGGTDDFLDRLDSGPGTWRSNNLIFGRDSPWNFQREFNYNHDPWRLNRRLNQNARWSEGHPNTYIDLDAARRMLEEAGFQLLEEEPGGPAGGRTADTFLFELTTNDGPRGNYVTTCVSDALSQPGTREQRSARYQEVINEVIDRLRDLRQRVPTNLPPQIVIRAGDNPFHDWNPNGARPFAQFQSFAFQNLTQ